MEAAKAFHYRWTDWLAESPILRAKMVAHEMIKGMRDSYNVEVRQAMIERGETPGPKAPPPWQHSGEVFSLTTDGHGWSDFHEPIANCRLPV